jgi:hypothetical protein
MQCIAHLWNSIDCDGNHFLLCLSPLHSVEGGAPTEAFANEDSLALRLADVGFSAGSIRKNMASLRDREETIWSNVRVPSDVFAKFGNWEAAVEEARSHNEALNTANQELQTRNIDSTSARERARSGHEGGVLGSSSTIMTPNPPMKRLSPTSRRSKGSTKNWMLPRRPSPPIKDGVQPTKSCRPATSILGNPLIS